MDAEDVSEAGDGQHAQDLPLRRGQEQVAVGLAGVRAGAGQGGNEARTAGIVPSYSKSGLLRASVSRRWRGSVNSGQGPGTRPPFLRRRTAYCHRFLPNER
jgi:hypothetical protein